MMEHIDFFKVGKTEEIRKLGWIKVHLLGRQIVIFSYGDEFIAIEMGRVTDPKLKAFLVDDAEYSKSGTKRMVRRLMSEPPQNPLGKLKQFPVRVDDDSVFVGIAQ